MIVIIKLSDKKLNKFFYKFLFAFLIVISLSLASYVFFHKSAYGVIKEGIIEVGNQDMLRFASDMDRNIYDVIKLIYKAKNDTSLVMIDTKKQINEYDYVAIYKFIEQSLAPNSMLENIFFYIKNNNIIVSYWGSYTFDSFFDIAMINSTRNKFFWADYFDKPKTSWANSKEVVLPQDTYYLKVATDGIHSQNLAVMLVDFFTFKNMRMVLLLNSDKVVEFYGENSLVFSLESGDLILGEEPGKLDKEFYKNIIQGSDSPDYTEVTINNTKYYMFYRKSQYFDWYYAKFIPYSSIFAKLDRFNLFSLEVILTLFCVSILLAYIFSRSFYRPIKSLVDLTESVFKQQQDTETSGNEIQKAYTHIKYVYQNYTSMKQKYSTMQEFYKKYFYEKLIKNVDITSGKNIPEELNIDTGDFDNFLVISYTINFSDASNYSIYRDNPVECDKIKLAVKELIDLTLESLEHKYYSFQVDTNSYIIIVTLKDKRFENEIFEGNIRNILLNDREYFYLNFSISNNYHSLGELKMAYDEAQNLANYFVLKEESQFLSKKTMETAMEYAVPKQLADKVKCFLELSNVDGLEQSMLEIVEHFEKKMIPVIYLKRSLVAIFNIMIENLDKNCPIDTKQVDYFYRSIETHFTKNEFTRLMTEISEFIRNLLNNEINSVSGNQVVEKMVAYINKNFSEDICLDLFAEKFKMSPIYISRLFKDSKKINFSDYVNQVRMENAKKLLMYTDLKVKDLSVKVGYRDPNTFIKVFKKYFGVAPGEYRKLMIVIKE